MEIISGTEHGKEDEKKEVPLSILKSLNFKMAYINPGYTDMQIGVRFTFLAVSGVITLWYLCTVCRIPRTVRATHDQKHLVLISIACVLFNDPTYLVSIYRPGVFTSIVSQLWVALFFTLLLAYWLRIVEKAKEIEN